MADHSQVTRHGNSAGHAFRRMIAWLSSTGVDDGTSPSIVSASGAPSAAEANGSVALRTNGQLYSRISAAWVAVTDTAGRASNLSTSAIFVSTEQTGSGAEQDVAHGFASTPSAVFVSITELPDAAAETGFDVALGTHDATNCKVTVTNTVKYRVLAIR